MEVLMLLLSGSLKWPAEAMRAAIAMALEEAVASGRLMGFASCTEREPGGGSETRGEECNYMVDVVEEK
jgi:hypothetical protein